MARPRKPTKILQFTSAFRKNPQRAAARRTEPEPSGEIGAAPAHLTLTQVTVWDEIVALSLPGVLSNADRIILEQLCMAVAAQRNESIRTSGTQFDSKLGAFIKACCEQLGMSPAARSKVMAKTDEKEKDDSFAAI